MGETSGENREIRTFIKIATAAIRMQLYSFNECNTNFVAFSALFFINTELLKLNIGKFAAMIQRIQTVYLALVVLIATILFFTPLYVLNPGETSIDSTIYNSSVINIVTIKDAVSKELTTNWQLIVVNTLLILIAVFAIVSFKDRRLQMKLSRALIFLSILEGIFIFNQISSLSVVAGVGYNLNLNPFTYALALVPILAFLAFRGIQKDDKLVRSADRLR